MGSTRGLWSGLNWWRKQRICILYILMQQIFQLNLMTYCESGTVRSNLPPTCCIIYMPHCCPPLFQKPTPSFRREKSILSQTVHVFSTTIAWR